MVMSESYKVQAAVYDRMEVLEKPLTMTELLVQQAIALDNAAKELTIVKQTQQAQAQDIQALKLDTRNGVPLNHLSKSQAHKMYGSSISKSVFETLMVQMKVPTQKYIHTENGHSIHTFAYSEPEVKQAMETILADCVQVSSSFCEYAKIRFKYVRPL